jgi:Zn-dependent M28 family amino/carboxypeptidase
MLRDLDALRTLGPRVEGSEAELTALAWIERTLAEVTGAEILSSDVPLPQGTTSRNVWVDLGSGDLPWIVLGAHVDSVTGSPGIDDNGSGVSLLLELARRLAADPVTDRRVTLAFFGAEEVRPGGTSNDHHYGSRAMAGAMAAAGELPDLMVSVDMVGVGDRLWAVPYRDLDPSAAEALIAAGEAVGVTISLVSRGDISDHEAFARAGTPAAMLWRPDNPAWHTADDTFVVETHLLDDLAVIEHLARTSGPQRG